MSNMKLQKAVKAALTHGHPWLTLGGVHAHTALPVSRGEVKQALEVLTLRGEVCRHGEGAAEKFRLAEREWPPQSPMAPAPALTPAASPAHVKAPPLGKNLTERLLNLLDAEGKPMLVADLATALDVPKPHVHTALSALARNQQVQGRKLAGKSTKVWALKGAMPLSEVSESTKLPERNAPAETQATPMPPNQPEEMEVKSEELEVKSGSENDELPKPCEAERYSYRSDGTLLMEVPGKAVLELDRDQTDRLFVYLSVIHEGIAVELGKSA